VRQSDELFLMARITGIDSFLAREKYLGERATRLKFAGWFSDQLAEVNNELEKRKAKDENVAETVDGDE
jgi:hypothetical protein